MPAGRFALVSVALRALRRRRGDSIAVLVLAAASITVLVNALYLQSGPHPSPMFSPRWRPVASGDSTGAVVRVVPPRPRPSEFGPRPDGAIGPRSHAEIVADVQRELERRGFYEGAPDGIDGPRTDAAIRDYVEAAGIRWNGELTEDFARTLARSTVKGPLRGAPASAGAQGRTDAIADLITSSARRVLAVQRALGDFGYGPVKATGAYGPETKSAIERFERDRKMPVTGVISDRLVRELTAATGRPIE